MQTSELPLFLLTDSSLTENISLKESLPSQQKSTHLFGPFENALKDILPQNREDTAVMKTRQLLGKKAQSLTDEQIQCIVTEFQFLINTWLDEFEQDVFNGMTLKEVINEK